MGRGHHHLLLITIEVHLLLSIRAVIAAVILLLFSVLWAFVLYRFGLQMLGIAMNGLLAGT